MDEARSLLESLVQSLKRWESGAIAGQVDRVRAELLWATGQEEEALGLFRRAIETLRHKCAVMDTAVVRRRLAEVFVMRGEQAAADMELRAAEAVFEAAGAIGYLAQCRALRTRAITAIADHGDRDLWCHP